MSIKIDALESEVRKQLDALQQTCTIATKDAARTAAEFARQEVKRTAPQDTGKYAKSWRVKVDSETAAAIHMKVYSPSRYMITHLLEYGHAKRGGGREVPAKPHLEAAQKKSGEEFMNEIMRGLKNG